MRKHAVVRPGVTDAARRSVSLFSDLKSEKPCPFDLRDGFLSNYVLKRDKMKFDRKFWGAVAILIGTIIGAGIFGLPYAVAKIGFIGGVFYLVLVTLLILIIHLTYAEVVLRTNGQLQMAGYAEKYLGQVGKILIALSLILGIYSAMIAYLIGAGNFLYSLLSPYLGGGVLIYSLLFWSAGSIVILSGLRMVSKIEFVLGILLVLMIFVIFFTALPKINLANLSYFSAANLFFPLTIFLFALGGASAVAIMADELKEKKKLLNKAIVVGTIIPAILYFIFVLGVIGVSGAKTTEQAMEGLMGILGYKIFIIGALLGLMTMTTSFICLGYTLRDLFQKDYKIPLMPAWLLTCFIPLIIFLLGLRNFVEVIGIGGSVLCGFQGILLLMMFYQAKKKGEREPEFTFKLPKILATIIALIFVFAIIYQFIEIIT